MSSFVPAVHAKAIQLDKLSLDMCASAGSGHPTSAMSLGQIVTVLMYHCMRWMPDQPDHPCSDRLVLSEGHAVPIVYAAYADLGGIIEWKGERRPATLDDLKTLRETESPLDGHPNPAEGFPFFDAATGSLGQGLSVAVGLGIAARMDDLDRRIYCIVGDGESREGQIAEALDLMVERNLTNVLPIFNCNKFGQSAAVSHQQSPEVLEKKLTAVGFRVLRVDGHDPQAIKEAIGAFTDQAANPDGQPTAIVAETVKGWGAPSVQGSGWHGKPATGDTLKKAISELDEQRVRLVTGIGTGEMRLVIHPPAAESPRLGEPVDTPSLREAMAEYDMAHILSRGMLATRKAYGIALRTLGRCNPNVVALDADVSNSTYSEMFAKDTAVQDRYVECRIGEQNMFSLAAGLSAAGKIPFCSTFAKFVTRAYDQIEMAVNSGANIKMIGSHAGISLAADGPSQMALPDISWFRSLATIRDHRGNPGCYVLQPSDAYAAYALTMAMAEYEGACYMRTLRPDTEFIYDDSTTFNLGGMEVLVEGRDLLIVASGYMVHEANKSLEALDKAGIDATLVDLYSIPFDTEHLLDLANENNGMILTVEDNYGGGFGSAVADALCEDGSGFTLQQMHVRRIPKSTPNPDQALRYCGLHHTDIVKTACDLLQVALV